MSAVWRGSDTYMTAGANDVLVEQPDSPAYKLGERCLCVRKFRGLYTLCVSSAVGRGTAGTGGMSGWWVSECRVAKDKPGQGELVIEYEASSAVGGGVTLPPDESSLEPFDLNPRLERHPNYSALTTAQFDLVREAVDNPDAAARLAAYDDLDATGQELVDKLRAGQDSYYLAGLRYTWTTYSWTIPSLTEGGAIVTPGGPLAGALGSYAWLSQCDAIETNHSYYKVTHQWLGGPSGHWDTDLYA